jgi:tagatose-6-phosphate ketose/aldose isomerase
LRNNSQSWLQEFGSAVPAVQNLLGKSESNQKSAGYFHTLREILQQPATWNDTASRVVAEKAKLLEILRGGPADKSGVRAVVLTGSGSSQYAGECIAPALQNELQVPVVCVPGGAFLTQGPGAAPPCDPCLVVSLARSGDSPESCAAVERLLPRQTGHRHLIITCNLRGKLAVNYRNLEQIFPLVLHPETNDQSLVMTSSFTNLVLAGRVLGRLEAADRYTEEVAQLSQSGTELMVRHTQPLADLAYQKIPLAVYLGSSCAYGAARESALKMLEMTGGAVKTLAETFLGLRHGPMALLHRDTLVVCFLASSQPARSYELDLIRELDRKGLGVRKLVVGENIPEEILKTGDTAIEVQNLEVLGNAGATVLYTLTGQILAFFQCMYLGLQPDDPSANGVISRVVHPFPIY